MWMMNDDKKNINFIHQKEKYNQLKRKKEKLFTYIQMNFKQRQIILQQI